MPKLSLSPNWDHRSVRLNIGWQSYLVWHRCNSWTLNLRNTLNKSFSIKYMLKLYWANVLHKHTHTHTHTYTHTLSLSRILSLTLFLLQSLYLSIYLLHACMWHWTAFQLNNYNRFNKQDNVKISSSSKLRHQTTVLFVSISADSHILSDITATVGRSI